MRKPALTAVLVLAVAVPSWSAAAADADAAKRPSPRALKKKLRLAAFDDCSDLVAYARRYAPRVDGDYGVREPSGGPGPVPAPPAGGDGGGAEQLTGDAPQTAPGSGDSSTTNVQEQGVDEPDFVKTDGKTLFTLTYDALHAVDARAETPALLDSLKVDGYGHELLVHGDRALVMSTVPVSAPQAPVVPATSPAYDYYGFATVLTEVDVSNPADLRVVRTETIDGAVVSARLSGDTVRVVISTPPAALGPGVPDTAERRLSGWVPSSTLESKVTGRKRTRRIVPCRSVRHPRAFAGLDMLTVLTIDMSRGLPAVDADSLMTGAEDLYASRSGLYVATHRWTPRPPRTRSPRAATPRSTASTRAIPTRRPTRRAVRCRVMS